MPPRTPALDPRRSPLSSLSIDTIYRTHVNAVRGFLARRDASLQEYDIDDLTQETFLRACCGLTRFRGDSHTRTYLLGIALNVLRESWRVRTTRTNCLEVEDLYAVEDSVLNPEHALYLKELSCAIAEAMRCLTPLERAAIERIFSGRRQKGQGNRGALRERAHSARKKLRRTLRRQL